VQDHKIALKKFEALPEKTQKTSTKPAAPDKLIPYAKKGDTVLVHYVGFLEDGMKEFDNSYTRKIELEFTVGVGQV
jgi:FKBP-type peptidyl-prolyl cis-trans isomerase